MFMILQTIFFGHEWMIGSCSPERGSLSSDDVSFGFSHSDAGADAFPWSKL